MMPPADGPAPPGGWEHDRPTIDQGRPAPRVRVSAGDAARPTPRLWSPTRPVPDEADAVYARGLVRTQLRLAAACLAAFLVMAAALAGVVFALPALDDPALLGVPLSWLLHAYGFYPLVLVFALIYARAAAHNERRYRALTDPETSA